MAYSLTGISDLGVIISEKVNKRAGIVAELLPGRDSEDTILIDLEGKVRNITIEGARVDTQANLQTFVGELADLITAEQTETITFSSDIWGSINVMVQDFNTSYEGGKPTVLFYTIKLIEGIGVTV